MGEFVKRCGVRAGRASTFVALAALAALAAVFAMPAEAADPFPSHAITLVVPLSAGGPTDVIARRFAEPLSAALHVPVVVLNVPGAGGAIGTKRVIDAPADGYTALVASTGITFAPAVLGRDDIELRGHLVPVAMLASTPVTLTVRADLPAGTLQDYLRYARAAGDRLDVAHPGNGSGGHLNSLLFDEVAHLAPTFIPYQGAGPILTALASGQVDAYLGLSSTDAPFRKSGRVRILAVSSRTRLPALADVPTMTEAGLPEFDASTWFGLFLPAHVPDAVLRAYDAAVSEALHDASYRSAVETELLSEMPPASSTSRAGFARFVSSEEDRWRALLEHATTSTPQPAPATSR